MKNIKFSKYQGNGNDFIIFDTRNLNSIEEFFLDNKSEIKRICNRNFGIGGDGIILISKSIKGNEAKMRIYNSDNSEAEMCGNGIRCLIQYLIDSSYKKTNNIVFNIETKAGIKTAKYNFGNISVKMGKPILDPIKIPTSITTNIEGIPSMYFETNEFRQNGYCVGMGNPHLIFFLDNLKDINPQKLGPIFENNKYFPQKTNVHFCKIINKKQIEVKVWERGAGATLACGTGACSIHVAAYKLGLCHSKTLIKLPGGDLNIEWEGINEEVIMTGKAKKVFIGEYKLK